MKDQKKVQIVKDLPNKKIVVTRHFDAAPALVWRAWTESHLLDQWWAPKPYRAETSSMDFREGGAWHYAMIGPEGDRHWSMMEFSLIRPIERFDALSAFTDEAGNKMNTLPAMAWRNDFRAAAEGTEVVATLTFDQEADLQALVDMGFEEGFTAGLGNLDELLRGQSE